MSGESSVTGGIAKSSLSSACVSAIVIVTTISCSHGMGVFHCRRDALFERVGLSGDAYLIAGASD